MDRSTYEYTYDAESRRCRFVYREEGVPTCLPDDPAPSVAWIGRDTGGSGTVAFTYDPAGRCVRASPLAEPPAGQGPE